MAKSRYVLVLIVVLVLLGVSLLACPALIRALPGRYAYYLPEPLQELRHNPHPDTLPTPAITHTRTPILTATPTSPTPTPTPVPPAPAVGQPVVVAGAAGLVLALAVAGFLIRQTRRSRDSKQPPNHPIT